MTGNPQTTATIGMVLAMMLSGSIGILVVESGRGALEVTFFRCLFGALVLALYVAARGRWIRPTGRQWGWMCASGVTMAGNWVLFFQAYTHAPISTVTIVFHVYPFVLMGLAVVLLGERGSLRSVLWALLAFAGVVAIALDTSGGAGIDLAGLGLTTGALLLYAVTLLITKRLADVSPALVTAVQLAAGAIMMLPLAGLTTSAADAATWSSWTWAMLATLGAVHTGLLYLLVYGALRVLPMASVAILSFLYPLSALMFDITVYDVRPGAVQLIGMAMILAAVAGERLGWSFGGVIGVHRKAQGKGHYL